ncbi:MAG TPA: alpha/beta fold hydrolase [Bryobacteraceae bacterium]|jgi:surfactin synthase thioesterase subunit
MSWTDCEQSEGPAPGSRLFCFPYAGAASAYRSWHKEMPRAIQVCAVQLPGRGSRFAEPNFTCLRPLVEALAENLSPLADVPFAFFGHSLGALIAFELAREMRRHARRPFHLFVSGLRAPQMPPDPCRLHKLPEAEFMHALTGLNGIPDQLIAEPEFLKLMLPALRADFEILETYEYAAEPPLDCRISAYTGRSDPRSPAQDLIFWERHTCAGFSSRVFPGDHFYIETAQRALLSAISVELTRTLMEAHPQ